MDPEKPISVGFNFGYLTVKDEGVAHPDTMTGRDINSAPLYLGGRGWLGKGTFQGYGGLALGVYITTTKTHFATKPTATVVQTGFGMGVPLGLTISLSKTFALNLSSVFIPLPFPQGIIPSVFPTWDTKPFSGLPK